MEKLVNDYVNFFCKNLYNYKGKSFEINKKVFESWTGHPDVLSTLRRGITFAEPQLSYDARLNTLILSKTHERGL